MQTARPPSIQREAPGFRLNEQKGNGGLGIKTPRVTRRTGSRKEVLTGTWATRTLEISENSVLRGRGWTTKYVKLENQWKRKQSS